MLEVTFALSLAVVEVMPILGATLSIQYTRSGTTVARISVALGHVVLDLSPHLAARMIIQWRDGTPWTETDASATIRVESIAGTAVATGATLGVEAGVTVACPMGQVSQ